MYDVSGDKVMLTFVGIESDNSGVEDEIRLKFDSVKEIKSVVKYADANGQLSFVLTMDESVAPMEIIRTTLRPITFPDDVHVKMYYACDADFLLSRYNSVMEEETQETSESKGDVKSKTSLLSGATLLSNNCRVVDDKEVLNQVINELVYDQQVASDQFNELKEYLFKQGVLYYNEALGKIVNLLVDKGVATADELNNLFTITIN